MSDRIFINYSRNHFLYQNIKCRTRLLNFWCRWESFFLQPVNEASRKSVKAAWKFIILSWIDRIDEHETCWIMNEFSHGNFFYSSTNCSSMNIFLKLHVEADTGCERNRWLVIISAQAFITEMERTEKQISNSNTKNVLKVLTSG